MIVTKINNNLSFISTLENVGPIAHIERFILWMDELSINLTEDIYIFIYILHVSFMLKVYMNLENSNPFWKYELMPFICITTFTTKKVQYFSEFFFPNLEIFFFKKKLFTTLRDRKAAVAVFFSFSYEYGKAII